jgi:hypothetical protein
MLFFLAALCLQSEAKDHASFGLAADSAPAAAVNHGCVKVPALEDAAAGMHLVGRAPQPNLPMDVTVSGPPLPPCELDRWAARFCCAAATIAHSASKWLSCKLDLLAGKQSAVQAGLADSLDSVQACCAARPLPTQSKQEGVQACMLAGKQLAVQDGLAVPVLAS